jgi:hypothetical protein
LEKPWIVYSETTRVEAFRTAIEAAKFIQKHPGTKFNRVGK